MLIYGMFPLLKNADMLMSTIVKQRRMRVDVKMLSLGLFNTGKGERYTSLVKEGLQEKYEYYKNIKVSSKLKSVEKLISLTAS